MDGTNTQAAEIEALRRELEKVTAQRVDAQAQLDAAQNRVAGLESQIRENAKRRRENRAAVVEMIGLHDLIDEMVELAFEASFDARLRSHRSFEQMDRRLDEALRRLDDIEAGAEDDHLDAVAVEAVRRMIAGGEIVVSIDTV